MSSGDDGSAPAGTASTKAKTKAALLGGLRDGRLEKAVGKMEADLMDYGDMYVAKGKDSIAKGKEKLAHRPSPEPEPEPEQDPRIKTQLHKPPPPTVKLEKQLSQPPRNPIDFPPMIRSESGDFGILLDKKSPTAIRCAHSHRESSHKPMAAHDACGVA